MEMSQDKHDQTKTCDPGAAAESIENGNKDSEVKGENPIVEAEDVDACKFTSPVNGTPTDLLNCPTAAGNFNGISEEGSKECIVTNNDGFPISCKSPCPLTISEAECGTSKEGNGFSVENNVNKEEKSVQHDDGDFTANKISPLVNDDEDERAKFLESLDIGRGSSDTAGKSFLSRERKKSKYLCYPFINLGKESKALPFSVESEIDDSKQHGDSSALVKCSKRKRESRKSLTSSIKLETLTASSAELLMQLHMVALDHLNPYYDSAFDSTELLFNRFRASVFSGLSNSEVMGVLAIKNDEAEKDEEDANKQNKNSVRKMRKEKPSPGLYDVNVNLASNSQIPVDSQTGFTPLSSNIIPQRKRKESTMSAPVGPDGEPADEHLQAKGCGRPKGEPGQKKRMRKKGTTPGISYINGNNVKPISLEVCLQDAGPYPMATSTGLNADVPSIVNGAKISTPTPEVQAPERVTTSTTSLVTNDKTSADVTIDQMKQSLEFMTAMLEKSANTISPETRASLEKEIKNLLKKMNPMA